MIGMKREKKKERTKQDAEQKSEKEAEALYRSKFNNTLS